MITKYVERQCTEIEIVNPRRIFIIVYFQTYLFKHSTQTSVCNVDRQYYIHELPFRTVSQVITNNDGNGKFIIAYECLACAPILSDLPTMQCFSARIRIEDMRAIPIIYFCFFFSFHNKKNIVISKRSTWSIFHCFTEVATTCMYLRNLQRQQRQNIIHESRTHNEYCLLVRRM